MDPALVRNSFAVVEPSGSQVAAYFYRHLFDHHPGVRALFAEHIDEQRDRLWAAIGTLVTHLEDGEKPTGILRGLGTRHAGYGTLPEHFPAVGASLIATLRHYAGEAWTPETEASWAAVYGLVSATMTESLVEARGSADAAPVG